MIGANNDQIKIDSECCHYIFDLIYRLDYDKAFPDLIVRFHKIKFLLKFPLN